MGIIKIDMDEVIAYIQKLPENPHEPFFILGRQSFTKDTLIEKLRKDKKFAKEWAKQIAYFNAEMGLQR